MKQIGGGLRVAASDEANFVACHHLTCLDLAQAEGKVNPPADFDIGFSDLIERGERHEKEVLKAFGEQGLKVAAIDVEASDHAVGHAATLRALKSGVDIVYQGVLVGESATLGAPVFFGRPDFLIRCDRLAPPHRENLSSPGGYEVVDAKLARTAKVRAVLQVAFYSALLGEAQGLEPLWMHLALGRGQVESFKVADFAAYEREVRRRLASFLQEDHGEYPFVDPYPEPIERCAICRWKKECAARRLDDDDLSLVAGITRRQRRELRVAGITSRRALAASTLLPDLQHVSKESLTRAQQQARLQVESDDVGQIAFELIDPERDQNGAVVANRGLLALPEPAEGDLFFDIEGSRYYTEDGREFGLQYLFGILDTADCDELGRPRYRQFWAFDRSDEKQSFEDLVDFITEKRKMHPGLHVYHYNHYEPTSMDHLSELHETRTETVGRLMGRFATKEDEVDEFFRRGIFVDLYRVVRQGARVGVASYSIKRLASLVGYKRHVELGEATRGLIAFEAALEDGTARRNSATQTVIAGYNEDDCRAALVLRDWLEECRIRLERRLDERLPRPTPPAVDDRTEVPEVVELKSALIADVPADAVKRSPEQHAKALLADLLGWHRRRPNRHGGGTFTCVL